MKPSLTLKGSSQRTSAGKNETHFSSDLLDYSWTLQVFPGQDVKRSSLERAFPSPLTSILDIPMGHCLPTFLVSVLIEFTYLNMQAEAGLSRHHWRNGVQSLECRRHGQAWYSLLGSHKRWYYCPISGLPCWIEAVRDPHKAFHLQKTWSRTWQRMKSNQYAIQ